MDLYPEPWMRTSSDIDVLVNNDDLKEINHLFDINGIKKVSEYSHELSFLTQNCFHIEIHDLLIEADIFPKSSEILLSVWKNAKRIQKNKAEYILFDDYFYFYLIAHMAKHFQVGGCGVRSIVDTWIYNHKRVVEFSRQNDFLVQGGLKTFDDRVQELAEVWFSNGKKKSSLNDFEEYIINGGIYGSKEHGVAIIKKKTGNRFLYYLSRFFPSYRSIRLSFPILKKIPVLLPFCWIIRWFRLLNPERRKNIMNEIKIEKSVSIEDASHIESLMKELEIW